MDFIRAAYKENKDGSRAYYPSLQVLDSQDLVIRGGQFMAVWDEDSGLYSRRISHLADIIDRSFIRMVGERLRPQDTVAKMRVYDNGLYSKLMGLIRNVGDMGPELDQRIVFANEIPTKGMAATFKMPYSLSQGEHPAWDEFMSVLYSEENRIKIEYAIGAIFAGASLNEVQKFYVFFGPPGKGKSTILNIIERLFEGHTAHFSAYDMGRGDAQFSLEPFARNPLVAIDQDGDLSKIELNKNLNSVVSHDKVLINSKGKNMYEIKPRATLFIGTNEPIKISNRKSGLFRRLVDIQPTGEVIDETRYHQLMAQVMYELGAIAWHCLDVFNNRGSTYLSAYRSHDMMYRTNDIFNFVQEHRLILAQGLTLKQAHKMYMEWCAETETRNVYKQYQFRDLLSDYFEEFHDQIMIDGTRFRSYFTGLRELEKFSWEGNFPKPMRSWLELDKTTSLLDNVLADMPAQYSTEAGTPRKAWENVTEKLSDLDTSKEHFVKVPTQHIIIDFDLTEDGVKSLAKNLEAAALWPSTYAELSRSGTALHLHYLWDGDITLLAPLFSDGIEVKTLLGGASLRRRHSFSNGLPVATISSGLPIKEKKLLSPKVMSNENSLRNQILSCLNKEHHGHTKSEMDFIKKILDDAQKQGMVYDVTDMWDDIFSFAMGSSNQRSKCLEIAMELPLKSEVGLEEYTVDSPDAPLAIFDCEVYPNFFAIGWIYEDADESQYVAMVNPQPHEVEELFDKLRLMGYNNRGYDNHICYGRTLGYDNQKLYELSQRLIVENDRRALFGAAYNMSYGDIYDILTIKQTLKKWQIQYGLPHKEMDLPWDEPVPEDRIPDVLEYLKNDVLSTREVLRRRDGDFKARKILAELSGLEVINTTRQHTERLVFGGEKDVSGDLVYTDLHEMFPGYKFDRFSPNKDKSTYRGEAVGEGGLVRSTPGMYTNVGLFDVASMHPTSIIELNLFGKYTKNFKQLLDTRIAIKNKRFEEAVHTMPQIQPFIEKDGDWDLEGAGALSDALKIVINSVYGLTAASFPNLFKDPNNIDNIVAKRGALFMLDLKAYLEEEGHQVIHIKTDSVKIPNVTNEIAEKVIAFGKKYGYDFEHEATYDRFCLLNDAVYVAHSEKKGWEAVGAQFQHPVVFKALFTAEEILPSDYVETKQVAKGHMYLKNEETGYKQFVGRFGAFVPVLNGRTLLRIDGDKEHAVTGTKGFTWELDEVAFVQELEPDMTYYQELIDEGIRSIEKFGDYAAFTRL
jgi:energy-coupling factor transporter ATP-binding protein EcfA2